ncbi:Gfo/Idh/MocA family protein [Leptospira kanakyensis]|uniref:Gfo/Idh/MocA family protein n=1 Tax=Leptospira kanakyensis TaxID=2484968 RepID=UPI00223E0378|nr:Gfo/Idh/MocA family oxidoreductase [Leptospira kanakyensis]MCW7471410.1 Gfo/Idh/MocA family oxidoreductase [Leptospira kanakyensis]
MEHNLKFLVIGLGSMGKRRIRNLKALGFNDIAGFDIRKDRRDEVVEKYSIPVFDSIGSATDEFKPQVFVISTSPKYHMEYAYLGLEKEIPCFIEASVVEADKIKKLYDISLDKNVIFAPSCTMRYFPGPKKVKELLKQNLIGKVLNINYHTGQYLPDWHPWESIKDFYVSDKETGGCREIVPFELTWLNDIFGDPRVIYCHRNKLTDMPIDIDDIYHFILEYPDNTIANITIDVVSRPKAVRELRILGSKGEMIFSADENCVKYSNIDNPNEWIQYKLDSGTLEKGYINPEEPYISEMQDFVESVVSKDQNKFPNTLLDDWKVLNTLCMLEKISDGV